MPRLARSADAEPKFAVVNISGVGSNEIVAAVTGRTIRVLSYAIVSDGSVTVEWRSATTPLSGAMSLAANGNVGSSAGSGSITGVLSTNVGEALNVFLGGAVGVRGHLTYIEI